MRVAPLAVHSDEQDFILMHVFDQSLATVLESSDLLGESKESGAANCKDILLVEPIINYVTWFMVQLVHILSSNSISDSQAHCTTLPPHEQHGLVTSLKSEKVISPWLSLAKVQPSTCWLTLSWWQAPCPPPTLSPASPMARLSTASTTSVSVILPPISALATVPPSSCWLTLSCWPCQPTKQSCSCSPSSRSRDLFVKVPVAAAELVAGWLSCGRPQCAV